MIRLAGLLVVAFLGLTSAAAADATGAAVHPWAFTSKETLEARTPTAEGFTRAAVEDASLGAFLRTLPLAPAGTQVRDFRGTPLYADGRHENIAAVVDVDIGARDLQQCADAVIRMHAEWRYGKGDRRVAYHAASGATLAYDKWLAGERMVVEGGKANLRMVAAPRAEDHAAFRAWQDDVFNWANTSSLAREGSQIPFADVRAGDFFVMPGSPYGHAVLVLDVAKDAGGRTALLLGQSYMPAQSFQVLRPSAGATWFVVEPGATEVKTPFWAAFPMKTLRRMP
jgi:hypothetical protein